MVSKSLKQSFNLLTAFSLVAVLEQASLWLAGVIFGIKVLRFLHFSRNEQCANFFSGCRRKHLTAALKSNAPGLF